MKSCFCYMYFPHSTLIFLLFKKIIILCVWVLCLHGMSGPPWTGVKNSCELPCVLEIKSGPLEEQPVFLITHPLFFKKVVEIRKISQANKQNNYEKQWGKGTTPALQRDFRWGEFWCPVVCMCVCGHLKKVEVTPYVHICSVLVLVRAWSNHVPWSWATWRPCNIHRRAGGASFHGFLLEEGKALRNASISLNASLQFIPNQAHEGWGDHLFHIRKGVCKPTTAFTQMTSRICSPQEILTHAWLPTWSTGKKAREWRPPYPSHKSVWQPALLKLYSPQLGVCGDLNSSTCEVGTARLGALGHPQFHCEFKAPWDPSHKPRILSVLLAEFIGTIKQKNK